jgi:hypothetical protein
MFSMNEWVKRGQPIWVEWVRCPGVGLDGAVPRRVPGVSPPAGLLAAAAANGVRKPVSL